MNGENAGSDVMDGLQRTAAATTERPIQYDNWQKWAETQKSTPRRNLMECKKIDASVLKHMTLVGALKMNCNTKQHFYMQVARPVDNWESYGLNQK